MKNTSSNRSGQLTQSVTRALSILNCFTDASPELRMTDISNRLDLTTSLVSRLLATLEHDGFVQQDPSTGMYRLGRMILTLAGVALNHDRLRMEALKEMQVASLETNLGVNLSVLDETAIFYLAHVETPEVPRPYTLIGRRNPLHATGMGKVLLANLPPTLQKGILQDLDLTAYTIHTITKKRELHEELLLIRDRGWALEKEELALGRACVAGPIRDSSGEIIGALSFSGPLSQIRFEQRQEDLTQKIIEVCDRISIRLGYITAPDM